MKCLKSSFSFFFFYPLDSFYLFFPPAPIGAVGVIDTKALFKTGGRQVAFFPSASTPSDLEVSILIDFFWPAFVRRKPAPPSAKSTRAIFKGAPTPHRPYPR